jgi:hypothetical protein
MAWVEMAPASPGIYVLPSLFQASSARTHLSGRREPDVLFAHKQRPKSEGQEGVTDQIPYHLTQRGPELNLRPWLAVPHLPVRAGCPVEQGRLAP